MTHYANGIKPEAEALLRSVIGAVSGVGVLRLRGDHAGHLIEVYVKLTGWSPSLNAFTMKWHTTVRADLAAEEQGDALVANLAAQIDMQRARLSQGLALGTAAPFGVSDMDGTVDDTKWAHVMVDQGLALLLQERHERGLRMEVSDSVFDLHQPDQGDRDGLETALKASITDDDCDPIGDLEHGLDGLIFHHDVVLAEGAHYDGRRLRLDRMLPETVLAIAGGRLLGDVAEVPACIADHVVTHAVRVDGTIEIHVEPHLRRAGDLQDEIDAAREAGRRWPDAGI